MKRCLILLIVFIIVAIVSASAQALRNPAAVYCNALGYEYTVEKTVNGDVGYCTLSDGAKVDGWNFLRGEVAQDRNYCALKGHGQRIVRDSKVCQKFLSDTCMVCVLNDGREMEVTELMRLTLDETVCGDKVCGIPENYKTCPVDCPSGSSDGYCDGVKDGKCDPDCTAKQDPDC